MSPRSSLRLPPEDLEGFPVHRVGPDQVLARIHRSDRYAAFYSSDGSGRFDLSPPQGTCYLREEPLASFVEVFREARVVAEALVATKALTLLRVREVVTLADVAHPRSRQFGVTGEIHTTTAYEATHAWATAFDRANFGGVRYRVRHDPAQDLIGVALFGMAGEGMNKSQLASVETSPIPTGLVAAAEQRFGIVVLPTP
ncbi:MAG: RES family NAD+ phosphorylase [Acidimicrobiales bacterium]